jgi:hypothetical protein
MAGIPTSRGDMLTKSHQSGRFVVRAFVALLRQLRKRAGMGGQWAIGGAALRGNPASSLTHHCVFNLNRLLGSPSSKSSQ